jgi:hypothetical protein
VQTHVDAVLPLAKQENGKPIFDGFLIATGFNSPVPINQCASAPSGSGAGQIKNAGVCRSYAWLRIARFCLRSCKQADALIATRPRTDFENMKLQAPPMPLRMNSISGQTI